MYKRTLYFLEIQKERIFEAGVCCHIAYTKQESRNNDKKNMNQEIVNCLLCSREK